MPYYDKAIALKPEYVEALSNRGNALQKLRRFDEALASYDRAIALKLDFADGYWNRALCLLLLGRYKEGWTDYEWRAHTRSPTDKPAKARRFEFSTLIEQK